MKSLIFGRCMAVAMLPLLVTGFLAYFIMRYLVAGFEMGEAISDQLQANVNNYFAKEKR